MYALVYVDGTSQIGFPVRLKIENSNDPTQSVETEAFTTVAGEWEVLEFDFNNEAAGTAALNTSYTFNMASIFFNFGTTGDNETIYRFDNISFGYPLSIEENVLTSNSIYPIPSSENIFLSSDIEFEVTIFNLLGEQVLKKVVKKNINISGLEKGVYILTLFDGTDSSSYKIIKK